MEGLDATSDLQRARKVLIEQVRRLERLPVSGCQHELADVIREMKTEALKLDDTLSVTGHGAILPVVGYLGDGL